MRAPPESFRPITGAPCAHGQIHDLADFRGVGFRERPAEHREILRENVDQAAVDAAVAGDESVAGRALLLHAEIVGVVTNEFVELLEGAFVEQQLDALARAELSLLVLALAALGAAACFGFGVAACEALRGGRGACGVRSLERLAEW